MQFLRIYGTLSLLLVFTCFSSGQTQPETGVEGVITISPIQAGPLRKDSPSSKPFANATFVVKGKKGMVTSFTTDNQGGFRISLAPGHYMISMKDTKPAIGNFGPFEIDVVAGKMIKVAWECDTGTR